MENLGFLKSNDNLSFVKYNTNTCTIVYNSLHNIYSNSFQTISIAIFNATTMVGNFLANLTVTLCLIKTKQISKLPCKMVLQLSPADVLIAVITQTLLLVDAIKGNSSCAMKTLFQCTTLFVLVAIYTINLIGYDRYLRVRYPVTHQEPLISTSVYMMLLLIRVVALLNNLSILVLFLIKLDIVRGFSGFIDFSVFLVVIFF